ncbi:MAG: tetratricopeptide repeat protein [Tepidisphaeraceae bacterium]|jgi:tetratricopeptide (TPR) repeat protein
MNDWSEAEHRVEKAQRFFEQRKWGEALRELQLATSVNPYNSSWFFNMGLILDELGRFEEAADAYEHASRIDPHDLATLNHLGVAQFRMGRLEPAVTTFRQIESLDPSYEPSYCNRILIYSQLGQHDLAEEMFYTARLYKEHCPHCFYNMGVSLEARGLHDKAIFCWTRALDLQGGQGDVYLRIGQALWKKGELEQARRSFLTDLRLNPGRTRTLLDLGELLLDMGRQEEAGEKFRRAIELAPSEAGGHYHLGRLLFKIGSEDQALECFATALVLDPTFVGANLGLGRIYYRRHCLTDARRHLRAELQLRPQNPRILLELGNLLMDCGESRSALVCLKWLVGVDPEYIPGWLNLAVTQFARGHWQEGIASCMTALTKDSQNGMAMHNLALAYERLGQYRSALTWVRRAQLVCVNDAALQRLELRVRLLWIRARTVKIAHQVRLVLPWLRR